MRCSFTRTTRQTAVLELVGGALPSLRGNVVAYLQSWRAFQFAVTKTGATNICVVTDDSVITRRPGEDLLTMHANRPNLANPHLLAAWTRASGAIPRQDLTVEDKVPALLGGEESLGNCELIGLDVYWTITGQINRTLSAE
jgi:hypothetical protein